jgi:hypothetical protein
MIGALARSGDLLQRPDWIQAAERAADFVLTRLRPEGRLLRSFRGGQAKVRAFQTDYVQLAAGLLELHRAGGEARWLETAQELLDEMHRLFGDAAGGGYFTTSPEHETLIARMKDHYDGVIPSGNAQAAMAFLMLHETSGRVEDLDRARGALASLSPFMSASPGGTLHALRALDLLLEREAGSAPAPDEAVSQVMSADGHPVVRLRAAVEGEPSRAGGQLDLELTLEIAPGWHINAHEPLSPEFVATELRLEGPALASLDALEYPEAERLSLGFSEAPLAVYQNSVSLRARVSLRQTLTRDDARLAAVLSFQACDDARCLAPETLSLEIPLELAS